MACTSRLILLVITLTVCSNAARLQYCGKQPLPPPPPLQQPQDLMPLMLPSSTESVSVLQSSWEADEFGIPPPPAADTGFELAQVFAFLRHGDRNVADTGRCWSRDAELLEKCRNEDISLPSSKQMAVKFLEKLEITDGSEKCATGQLTTYGFKQHLRNGKIFKKAYIRHGFISPEFNHEEMYVRSTDYSRTISSAQALLIGMFERNSVVMHFDHLLDINVENRTHGIIQPNTYIFPEISQYVSVATNLEQEHPGTEVHQSMQESLSTALQVISDQSGRDIKLHLLTEFFDCLNVNHCHNRTIPANEELLNLVNRAAPLKYKLILSTPDPVTHGKYSVGPLLAAVQNEMLKCISKDASGANAPQHKKMYIFVGHDTGPMMPLLSAFQIWEDGRWPSYASKIVLELYENKVDNMNYAVRVIYDGKEQLLPGCDSVLCDWRQFSQILDKLMPPQSERFLLNLP